MTKSNDVKIIAGRIHELERRKREAKDQLESLKQEMLLMVCANEAEPKAPSVFVSYDRQGAWEFEAICSSMRKAIANQRSRQRMVVRGTPKQK